jgi:hypothetical protein
LGGTTGRYLPSLGNADFLGHFNCIDQRGNRHGGGVAAPKNAGDAGQS